MKFKAVRHEICAHFRRHGLYSWVPNVLAGYGLLLISQVPLERPVTFGAILVGLSVLAVVIYGLCRLFPQWNPETLGLWEQLYFVSQVLFMGMSSLLSIWVMKEEGVLSLPGLVAVSMVLISSSQAFILFFPRAFYQYLTSFIILGPVLGAVFLLMGLDNSTKWVLVGVFTLFALSMVLRTYLWRREFSELLQLKRLQEGEKFLLQKLLDTIPAKISWFDKDFRYKMTNRSLTHYLGLAPQALIGQEFGLRHDPEFKLLNRKLNAFRASNQTESYFEHPVKVGQELRRHHIILKKINTVEGTEVLMITLDIEDLKRAQEILSRKETG